MNNVNQNDQYFEFTELSGMAMLDEVERYEVEFTHIYLETLAFLETMVDATSYENIKKEMILNAGDFEGHEYSSKQDIEEGVWAAYHPVPLLFSRLCWYGEKGLFHYNDVTALEDISKSDALKGEIRLAKEFHQAIPSEWLESDEILGKGSFGKTIFASEGRLLLDSGDELKIEHIIALSGMSLRSVRNSLSKNDASGLRTNENGNIDNDEARRWLADRKNFRFTTLSFDDESLPTETEEQNDVEYVFVPVADDGTVFLPKLRRENGYQVGKKGEETYHENFYEALKALQSMAKPRFRRPNEQGNWGIKVGTSWVRIPKPEVDKELK